MVYTESSMCMIYVWLIAGFLVHRGTVPVSIGIFSLRSGSWVLWAYQSFVREPPYYALLFSPFLERYKYEIWHLPDKLSKRMFYFFIICYRFLALILPVHYPTIQSSDRSESCSWCEFLYQSGEDKLLCNYQQLKYLKTAKFISSPHCMFARR